jgi:DNA primase
MKTFNRRFDRKKLPSPVDYYQRQFPKLKVKPKWTNVSCPFHEDSKPSLGIDLTTGGFHCFSCGIRGSDLVSFQMKRYQMTFCEAISFLGAWCYDRAQ